ncbi:MAG: hypothetical protein K6U10_02530 [Acidobacteriia bacterium]|nr:hypothetical protein [Methyloceanibacter sp.]MCL6490678.1 hypothetical protein [Terriglobia bacterium]
MLLVRGEPEQLIEAAFRRIFPKTASVGQIIEEIQHTTGKRVVHGTAHRVVQNLMQKRVLERVGNTAAYRFVAEKSEAAPSEENGAALTRGGG